MAFMEPEIIRGCARVEDESMIRDDEDCDECGVAAVRRTCDECGVSAMITDCGCQIQPRPIAADGRRTYCDDCYAEEEAEKEIRDMYGDEEEDDVEEDE